MVINPYSISTSSDTGPLVRKVATFTSAPALPVETVEIGAEPTTPSPRKSLCTRVLLGAGAAVALAAAVAGCAPNPGVVTLPPLVPGTYQVSHQVTRGPSTSIDWEGDKITDVCDFERSDGEYRIISNYSSDESKTLIHREIMVPGRYADRHHRISRPLVGDSGKVLSGIISYCLQTETPDLGVGFSQVTIPQPEPPKEAVSTLNV